MMRAGQRLPAGLLRLGRLQLDLEARHADAAVISVTGSGRRLSFRGDHVPP